MGAKTDLHGASDRRRRAAMCRQRLRDAEELGGPLDALVAESGDLTGILPQRRAALTAKDALQHGARVLLHEWRETVARNAFCRRGWNADHTGSIGGSERFHQS